MNKHFAVINKKATILSAIFIFINIVAFTFSFYKISSGGSKLWIIPAVIFIGLFIIGIMIITSVLTAGIDVKADMVILPDQDPRNGKVPKFNIEQLSSIELCNENGPIDFDRDSLSGARIIFHLSNDETEQYYPVYITKKQYESIKNGMMELRERM